MSNLHLVRDLLDHPVRDREDEPCGIVDDVELEAAGQGRLEVTAIWIGPGAAARRLWKPFAWMTKRCFGAHSIRIPVAEIEHIGAPVRLGNSAAELGLNRTDRRWKRWLLRIPGA